MLKSLGLWKESTPEVELREDMEYPLTSADTQMLVEGRGEEVGRKYLEMHERPSPWVTFYKYLIWTCILKYKLLEFLFNFKYSSTVNDAVIRIDYSLVTANF